MLARLYCQLYYDEPYLVGQDIICKYLLDRWNIPVDKDYKTEHNTLKWSLPTGQSVWGVAATLNTGRGGPQENGEIFVLLHSDIIKHLKEEQASSKQAAALSEAGPTINYSAAVTQ